MEATILKGTIEFAEDEIIRRESELYYLNVRLSKLN
jgi:hypothetical protein